MSSAQREEDQVKRRTETGVNCFTPEVDGGSKEWNNWGYGRAMIYRHAIRYEPTVAGAMERAIGELMQYVIDKVAREPYGTTCVVDKVSMETHRGHYAEHTIIGVAVRIGE